MPGSRLELDGLRGRHASAIDPGEDLVDGLQRTGHLEIGELGPDPVTARAGGGLH